MANGERKRNIDKHSTSEIERTMGQDRKGGQRDSLRAIERNTQRENERERWREKEKQKEREKERT